MNTMTTQRKLLGAGGVVLIAVLAFAAWRAFGPASGVLGQWPELNGGVYAEPVTHAGQQYLVPPDEVYASGLEANDRPTLTDPKLVSVATADAKLADSLEGISISVNDQTYFYPFQILNWHEVVQSELAGGRYIITYSPLTGSGVVYIAYNDQESGELLNLKDSGRVYNNALLLEDDNGTLWNQTTGQAIVGEAVGQFLPVYTSQVMSWAVWKDLYPNGLTLSTETGFVRDYGRHPYASYETSPAVYFPLNHTFGKVQPKDLVYRVELGDAETPIVYLDRYLPAQEDVNMVFEGENGPVNVVAFYDETTKITRAFNSAVDGQILTFTQKGNVITDAQTNSRWSPTGVAISGELRGKTLFQLDLTRHYAFALFAMQPNARISGAELLPTEDVVVDGIELEIK